MQSSDQLKSRFERLGMIFKEAQAELMDLIQYTTSRFDLGPMNSMIDSSGKCSEICMTFAAQQELKKNIQLEE